MFFVCLVQKTCMLVLNGSAAYKWSPFLLLLACYLSHNCGMILALHQPDMSRASAVYVIVHANGHAKVCGEQNNGDLAWWCIWKAVGCWVSLLRQETHWLVWATHGLTSQRNYAHERHSTSSACLPSWTRLFSNALALNLVLDDHVSSTTMC